MGSCTYKPALLTKRVTLQSLGRSPDSQGGFLETWRDAATLRAQVTPLKGYKRMQAMQLASPVTHKLLIRYRSGLTPADRLVYGLRVLEIKEVIDVDERHAWMQLTCIEGKPLTAPGPMQDWEDIETPWERIATPW